ncbi:MAG: helix-turn-helix domain-containing protein [Acutalibacteraceae bacterium]
MDNDFPRIITLLRKERGLSQKQAAAELGVSQALLSHYEKGIRECGLDFVVRVADYYNVSCDYLLGRTPDRQGATLKVEDIPDSEPDSKNKNPQITNNLVMLNKKLIMNSINIIFELLEQINCKPLTNEISSYLMVSVYKMIRTVYSINPKNPQAMFSVIPELYMGLSSALQNIVEVNAKCIVSGKGTTNIPNAETTAALSPEIISNQYPDLAPSLYNLIQKTEEKMKKLY